jgi:hypothetical protein
VTFPVPKVEIGFNLVGSDSPFFTLDSATKGRLDNTDFRLSGFVFYEVTSSVKSVAIRRGKNRQLDEFDPGLANIVFNNQDRTFDPEFPNSPFAGQIIPKRTVRISSGGVPIFTGSIDDWNLDYDPSGDSEASAACSDSFASLNNRSLVAGTAIPQTTSERINTILDSQTVNWPQQDRLIEEGLTALGADVIEDGTNALQYLRTVSASEPGSLFVGKQGQIIFKNRNPSATSDYLVFSDDGEGISYQNLRVVYGSELLYNQISISNVFSETATATDVASVEEYGALSYKEEGLLISDGSDLLNIAILLASRYAQPEYRFESIDLVLNKYDFETQEKIIALEIGDVVQVEFTPNNIPPAITKFAEVIRIDHSISAEVHVVSLGFATIEKAPWTLSDPVFGRLSAENILSF